MKETYQYFTLKNGKQIPYRKLQRDDKQALARFNDELSEHSRNLFTPHRYDQETLDKIIERVENGEDLAYVALDNDRIIAYFFLWWYNTPFPVLGIGILDEYHGQGLGKQIMQKLIDDARKAGCDAIELTTALDNKSAYALYEKVGFKCLGQVDNVAGDGRIIKEWHMFYPFKPNIIPPARKHCSPV